MSSVDGDPFDWTVEEVIDFLCHSPETPWSQSAKTPRPDPALFEVSLRENDISGEVLLNDVDKDELRNDLGVKSLGQRSSMIRARDYLRERSLKYQDPNANTNSHLGSRHSISATPNRSNEPSPAFRNPPSRGTTPQQGTPNQYSPMNTSDPVSHNRVGVGFVGLVSSALEPSRLTEKQNKESSKRSKNASIDPSDPESNKNIRRDEHYVFDQNGKKRRRLELAPANETQPTSFRPQTASVSADKVWYMGPNSITPDELFYPLNADEDGESFVIASPRFPTAQSSFVNKCLKYFYRQQPVKLNGQSGNSQWALLPYRPSKSRQSYFTLYTSKGRDVIVTKENLKEWPQIDEMQTTDSGPLEDYDVYSFIAQKYQNREDYGEDPILPCYGDSGSEGEYDEETWQEIDDEQHDSVLEQNKQSKLLTPAEVDLIIDTSITEYEKKWQQIHMPKKEWKSRGLWVDARKKKCTNQKIQAFRGDIDYYEDRLKKLRREIRKGDYATKSELKIQCKSMEQTVFNIQELSWCVSVLERETCPPVIAAHPKPRRKPKPRIVGDDESLDYESLDSESDGFIDDDYDEPQADTIDNPEGYTEPVEIPSTPLASSDDEVIIPPRTKRRSRTQNKEKDSSKIEDMPERIDLTQDSDSPRNDATPVRRCSNSSAMEDLTIETPPLNPTQPNVQESPDIFSKTDGDSSVSPAPDTDASKAIAVCVPPGHQRARLDLVGSDNTSSMTWEDIEECRNRGLFLKKSIESLSDEERNQMAVIIPPYDIDELEKLVKKALRAIRAGSYTVKELEDVRENQVIMRTSTFFISWVIGVRLGKKGILSSQVGKAIKSMCEFRAFFNELRSRLTVSKTDDRARSGSRTPQDPNMQHSSDTPHKKRKREVKESQDAKSNQKAAQGRAALQAKQRKALEQKMMRMGLSNGDPTHQAVSFRDPVIYLDPHIGQHVKPHQLKGIQFMWRELIEDDKHQGCLLAHTMGLGKTMQVISLLDTIAAAACSADESVFQQIPEQLRRSQTLVLCPSSVVENWYEEFIFWSPPDSDMGPLRKITSGNSLDERLQEAFDWDQEGGILILSYDIFRMLIENKETKTRARPLEAEAHQNIKDCLLNGPNIIVADEAHKMKNSATGIAATTKQFRSKSRIALTGTPLANDLIEYFSAVDWIAPRYLGDFVGFKANYVEPIEEGLYIDSTAHERKKSLIKLKVLKTILEPKIDRADITALEGSLPPKVEFVITVPLTEVQEKAYNSYIESLWHGNGNLANTKLWSWLAILSLCCNHPACFREKLLSRTNDVAKVANADLDTIVGDESVAQASLPEELITQQTKIFDSISDMMDLELSYRTQILDKIVKLSVQAGDKVLVFSHSIPTLNYIESLLQAAKHKYCRLDGSTPMHGRQAATKKFNTQSEHQVYLISTRAGGLGLNIPGANRVVIFDFKWNPVWEEQAVGRSYRIGQTKPVYVYRFISGGTYEEVVYNKTIFKTQLAYRVVDGKSPVRRASRSPGDYLFPVKPVKQMDVSEFVGKDPSVLDQIINNDQGIIRRIALTETFQKEDNDKLTEEDDKEYQTQLSDEQLRRTDPAAYEKLIRERQAQYMNTSLPPQPPSGPAMQNNRFPSTIPGSAHNVGPPPLPPDTSVSLKPSLKPLNVIGSPNEMPMEMSHKAAQSTFSVLNGQSQVSSQTGSFQQDSSVENSGHSNPGTPQQPRNNIFSRIAGPSQVDGSGSSGVCQQQ
ncbi:SNF2 family helicase ATPase [Aspergillus sclerotialis]|uniref:SNF2 family helicase ATPase n=1 Tax=Aspergillus sclerotialis TaxID=2070753 RepID=A0A3A2ZKY1_9EURO|nr:SNF2 family helicase ATPase [Aspergillus sclerotialis]